jgi:hypothetical protein
MIPRIRTDEPQPVQVCASLSKRPIGTFSLLAPQMLHWKEMV